MHHDILLTFPRMESVLGNFSSLFKFVYNFIVIINFVLKLRRSPSVVKRTSSINSPKSNDEKPSLFYSASYS